VAAADEGMMPMSVLAARRVALIVACMMLAPAASAQPAQNEAAQAMVGGWEFSNADRDKRCTITFRTDAGPAGMKLEFDKDCPKVFPFIKEIAGWSIAANDFLRLLDPKGKPVLEFSEVESGLFEAPKPGEGILFIQSAAAAGPAPKLAEQMTGEWTMVRSAGKTLCTLTLTDTPAGSDLAVRVRPGCDPAIARFAPNAWAMDRSELVLKGARDAAWRFSEGDEDGTWQRVPDSDDPLLMVKK
jgi:hypothetical protein